MLDLRKYKALSTWKQGADDSGQKNTARTLKGLSSLLVRKTKDKAFSPVVCCYRALISFLGFLTLRAAKKPSSIRALFDAHRQLLRSQKYNAPLLRRFRRIVERNIQAELSGAGQAHSYFLNWTKDADNSFRILKDRGGIVLKRPRLNGQEALEKGVLLLKYSRRFSTFCNHVDMKAFLRDYALILEPSWSAYANPNILRFTRFAGHPIIVMATEKWDYQFLENLRSNLIPVSFGCSDWVHPSIFRPLDGTEKIYDAVMIARWASYKRHHVLFRALHKLKDPSLRVALVASPWPPKRTEIESLIDIYGIRDNIRIFDNLSPVQVNEIFNQSKVNLLLSLLEGGNKSIFEGFFSGVPGLILRNNIGLQKDYFTPQTGRLIEEKELASELLHFHEHWHDFNPRPWAMANISPEVTTAKLNEMLKDLAIRRGEEWTRDLVAKCNSPNLEYYPDKSAGEGMPSMEEILVRYARRDGVREVTS